MPLVELRWIGTAVVAGYRAPELLLSSLSHGDPMLSLMSIASELCCSTGKSPIQALGFDDVVDIPRWVHSVVLEEWTAEVFDMELMRRSRL